MGLYAFVDVADDVEFAPTCCHMVVYGCATWRMHGICVARIISD